MTLTFINLAFYTPTELTLTMKGSGTVTKALSDVTISGDNLTYSPTSSERSSLGSGTIYAQVKMTAGTDYLKSEVLRLTAADLDKTLDSKITLCEDFGKEIELLQTAVNGKVSKSGDTMTGVLYSNRGVADGASMIIRHNAAKGAAPATEDLKYVQFTGSGNSGTTGFCMNRMLTSGASTTEIRASSILGAGYSLLRIQQNANGTGSPQFYQSADSTLGVAASGPWELYHKGNLPIDTAIKMEVFGLSAGSNVFTVPTNSRHFLFFAATGSHGIAECQAIGSGATYYYDMTTTAGVTATTATNKLTLNNTTSGVTDLLVITVRGTALSTST